jgi:hypothetical protein
MSLGENGTNMTDCRVEWGKDSVTTNDKSTQHTASNYSVTQFYKVTYFPIITLDLTMNPAVKFLV